MAEQTPKKSFKDVFNERTGINFSDKELISRFYTCLYKYVPILISVVASVNFIFIATTENVTLFNNKYFIYLALITLPIIITYGIRLPTTFFSDKIPQNARTFLDVLFLVILIFLVIFIFFISQYLSSTDITILVTFRILLSIFITLLAVYIIYNISQEQADKTLGVLGVILRFILIIPQTFVNIYRWIFSELSPQNIAIFSMLALLAIAFVFYIYFREIINYFANIGTSDDGSSTTPGTSRLLLKGPVSINTEAAFSIINPPTLPDYTFSFWLYVNNSPTSNYEIPIFKYGGGIPYVTLNNNLTNNMNFYPSDHFVTSNQPIPFSVPTQKWNYIVVQYGNNTADLYLNCSLIVSVPLADMPTYVPGDNAVIGNTNIASYGIGAISNVNYYTSPLTMVQMNSQYQLLSLQNIPSGY